MTRVKLSVEHLRTNITEYLETTAPIEAELIATKTREAIDAFDFDTAIERICRDELEKFVRDAAAAYFRTLLTSPEAHAAILDQLATTISKDHT